MYEDLARSQERGLPEQLAWSVLIPSLLATLVLHGIRIGRANPPVKVEIDRVFSCPSCARE